MSVTKKFKAVGRKASIQTRPGVLSRCRSTRRSYGERAAASRSREPINGFPYRTNIQRMDGRHLLTFNKHLQAAAKGKAEGYGFCRDGAWYRGANSVGST